MGNLISRKCKKMVRLVLLKNLKRRRGTAGSSCLPPVPCPPKMHCFLTTQIGIYIQQAGVQLPPTIAEVPAGLEYLTMVNELSWNKIQDPLEVSHNAGTGNKYCVNNLNHEQVFFCFEKSSIYSRWLAGPFRDFQLHFVDNFNREVVRLSRSVSFNREECKIESPPGTLIGTIHRAATWKDLRFKLRREGGEEAMELTGPGCLKQAWSGVEWKASLQGNDICSIEKQRIGCILETGLDQDEMALSFSPELDVRQKAMLLGASFLLDCFLLDTPKSPDEETYSMLATMFMN